MQAIVGCWDLCGRSGDTDEVFGALQPRCSRWLMLFAWGVHVSSLARGGVPGVTGLRVCCSAMPYTVPGDAVCWVLYPFLLACCVCVLM